MGLFFSKESVNIDRIESDVVGLTMKLRDEEENIDKYVKNQITEALRVYLKQIEQETKKKHVSPIKSFKIKDSIDAAIKQLAKLPVKNYELKNTTAATKNFHELKNYLFDVVKDVENDGRDENHYQNLLKAVTAHSYRLYSFPTSELKKEEKEKLSILFLTIYLKCPKTKVSTKLKVISQDLDEIIKNFDCFDFKNVNPFHAEETKRNLIDIKTKTNAINKLSREGIAEMDRKSGRNKEFNNHGGQHLRNQNYSHSYKSGLSVDTQERSKNSRNVKKCHNLLNYVDESLNEYTEIVGRLCPPIGDQLVVDLTTHINNLIIGSLKQIKDENEGIAQRKEILHKKGTMLLSRLQSVDEATKEINKTFELLQKIEDKIFQIVSSPVNFAEKKKHLEACKEKLNGITNNYNEICVRKEEILNTIEGVTVFEISNSLKQLSKTIKQQQSYAAQFPFPTYVMNYDFKCKEVKATYKYLEDLPKEYPYMETLMHNLHIKINSVLETLNERGLYNEQVISALDHLENIKNQVTRLDLATATNFLPMLQCFNQLRQKIEEVENTFNGKVTTKKIEMRLLLQSLEENILTNCSQDFQEIKIKLNEYEKQAWGFISSDLSELYRQKQNEIICFGNKLMKYCASDDPATSVISGTLDLIWQLLENMGKKNEETDQCMHYLNEIEQSMISYSEELSTEKRFKTLEGYQNVIKSVKKSIGINNLEVLNKVADIETKMAFERSKLDMVNTSNDLKFVKESINSEQNIYKRTIDKLFFLKNCVEDMPQGDPELDSQKQRFLEELYKCLELVDATLAKYVITVKQPESILELKSHFDFNADSLNVSRDSIEFVRLIRKRAEFYEDSVKFYLGTNYSVDYYVIHENLVRLLEELDKIVCTDNSDMLTEMVKVMEYTKGLIRQLDNNATDE